MAFIASVESLNNNYFDQRHGRSFGNLLHEIVSNLPDGISGFGLTEEGCTQVMQAALHAKEQGLGQERPLLFVVSPLLRAVMTARISQSILGGEIIFDDRLVERFFGDYDLKTDKNLDSIWQLDALDENNTEGNVESPAAVQARINLLITELEGKYEGYDIVFVSHGDTLQIAETAFERIPSSRHRLLPHLQNGEIRRLNLKTKPAANKHSH